MTILRLVQKFSVCVEWDEVEVEVVLPQNVFNWALVLF